MPDQFPDQSSNGSRSFESTGLRLKTGLAEMLKGGVIMDVMDVEQAIIAEQAGAVAVMALERVPAMIRATGGVARMSHPGMIKAIQKAVTIPVMAKVRIGHFVEAQILEQSSPSTTSTSPKSSPPPTSSTTSTSTPSKPPSSAAQKTSAKPSAASPRAPP